MIGTTTHSPASNQSLANARAAKKDEFYTRLEDIESELKHYRDHLRGKTVLCNCDDPFESNFFKYFARDFNRLGLKKLIATSYEGSPIAGGELPFEEYAGHRPNGKQARLVEINEVPDLNADGATNLFDVEQLLRRYANTSRRLHGDGNYGGGDFRSLECVDVLKRSDIVVTNPPFSLFREYVAQLVEHAKQFLVIGNVNSITFKDIFKLIKDNKLWLGPSIRSGDREFRVPDHYPLQAAGYRVDEKGIKYIRVKGVRWFTNLEYKSRYDPITLYKKYNPIEYPIIDNYDAINVDKVAHIPVDYDGRMGVPITFLDQYSPHQFEILAITKSWLGAATKTYPKQVQVSKDGSRSEVTKLNDGPALRLERPPIGETYYLVGTDVYRQLYQRLIIRRKT